ncbi:MAG: hypothetical protein VKP72_13030 [bacterium]|nr:hypothetical protein [bacterium]
MTMSRPSPQGTRILVLGSVLLVGCVTRSPQAASSGSYLPLRLSGRVESAAFRTIQASIPEIVRSSAITVSDATTGKTVATTVSDSSGAFTLNLTGLRPGALYFLDATRGLSAGGSAHRGSTAAARLRTLLMPVGSALHSLTNTNTGSLVIGNATTALAATVAARGRAGAILDPASLMGKVDEATDTFSETGTGLSNTSDFMAVLPLVGNAILLDQDPVAAIALQGDTGTYRLTTNLPALLNVSPRLAAIGATVTVSGDGFDPYPGRIALSIGNTPVATYSLSADRRRLTFPVPAGAVSGPLVLLQPGGVQHALLPLFKVRGTMATLAGNGLAARWDGPAAVARFNTPMGLALDSRGNLVVADSGNHCIRRVTPEGQVTTLAGDGVAGAHDGPALVARFNTPRLVAVDAGGYVYVGDWGNGRIRRIGPDGRVTTLSTWGGFADNPGTPWVLNRTVTGPWTSTSTNTSGVTLDPAGNLYFGDYYGSGIMKVTPTGGISLFVGATDGAHGTADGTGTAARLSAPDGLAFGADGYLYCFSNGANHCKRITLAGVTQTLSSAGSFATNPASIASQIVYQSSVLADGTIYGPYGSSGLYRVTPGTAPTQITTTGSGYADGPIASAQFRSLFGSVADAEGTLFVSDMTDHRIRVVVP